MVTGIALFKTWLAWATWVVGGYKISSSFSKCWIHKKCRVTCAWWPFNSIYVKSHVRPTRWKKNRLRPQFNVQGKNSQFKDAGRAEASVTLVSDSPKQHIQLDVTRDVTVHHVHADLCHWIILDTCSERFRCRMKKGFRLLATCVRVKPAPFSLRRPSHILSNEGETQQMATSENFATGGFHDTWAPCIVLIFHINTAIISSLSSLQLHRAAGCVSAFNDLTLILYFYILIYLSQPGASLYIILIIKSMIKL